MIRNEYAELRQFLAGYLHQDWTLDYPSADSAVHAFMANSNSAARALVVIELQNVLLLSDEALAPALLDLGAYYDPMAEGRSERDWLQWVATYLNAESR